MSDALKVSSDVFFYQLGEQANDREPRRSSAGPSGSASAVRPGSTCRARPPAWCPTAAWRNSAYAALSRVRQEGGPGRPGTTAGALQVRRDRARSWTTGDNVNLAVGQGDLQATPLQVAVAYSALANDGTIVQPHLGQAIEDGNGVTLQELPQQAAPQGQDQRARPPGRARRPAACRQRGGRAPPPTSSRGWPSSTRSTARPAPRSARPNPDQAWYACFVKDAGRPIVVVVTVERGGFGAETAAPAARMILSEWFDVSDREFHAGTSDQAMSAQTIQPASEPPPPLVPREWRLRLDPLLVLATLGLVACSLIALRARPLDDVDTDPLYYVKRQGVYVARRPRADVRRLAPGLLAPARAALPDLRRAAGHRSSRCWRSRRRRAGPGPGSSCRASASSPPSSARCCWWWRWPASSSSGCARWGARRRPG